PAGEAEVDLGFLPRSGLDPHDRVGHGGFDALDQAPESAVADRPLMLLLQAGPNRRDLHAARPQRDDLLAIGLDRRGLLGRELLREGAIQEFLDGPTMWQRARQQALLARPDAILRHGAAVEGEEV